MPLQLSRQGIRLRADERSRQPLLDAYTNATPQGWVKASTQFEVALARGGALVDVSNLTAVTLQGTPDTDRDGARAFAQTVPLANLDNTLTESTWADGTRQHALFSFSQAEMNLPVSGDGGSADYWIVITALTADGDQIVCGSGRLTMVDDGVFQTAAAPPANPGAALTLGEADARYLQPGQTAAHVPTGATLLVDAAGGNDSTAARGTLAPFATLTAAKTAALAGDLIRVRPGTYNETDLGKNGVGWDFAAGAVVAYTGLSTVGIWDDHAGPLVCRVSGAGTFQWNPAATTFTGAPTGCVNIQNAGSEVNLDARLVATGVPGGSPGTGALNQGAGILRVRAFRIENSAGGVGGSASPAAIWWTQGELHVDAFEIAAGKYGLYTNALAQVTPNQAVWIRVNYLRCPLIQWQGDPTSQLWLDALEIDLSGAPGAGQMNLLGGKAYVQAQKVFVNGDWPTYLPPAGALTAGNAWLWIMKLTQAGNAPALKVNGCAGQIDQIEDAGGACRALLYGGSGVNDLLVQKMIVTNPNGIGVEHNAGTLRLRGACIDATAATAGNPVKVDAPGLTLAGASLVAAPGQDSVASASAQSVGVVGALAANRPAGGSVTLDVSQNLPTGVTVGGEMAFVPDGTYSIGAAGKRPVDVIASRSLVAPGVAVGAVYDAGFDQRLVFAAALLTLTNADGSAGAFALGSLTANGTATLLPRSGAPAAPGSGVTLYVDAAGDLHALHASGTDHTLSAP